MYWKIALILGIFLVIDILGHLCFKIKRNIFEWILIAGLILCTTGTSIIAISNQLKKNPSDGSAIFMAYKYLNDGNIEQSRIKLSEAKGTYKDEAEILDVFADVISGDFIQGYFKTERLLSENKINSSVNKYLKEIQKICEKELGMTDDTNESPKSYDEYIKNLSANDSLYMNGNNINILADGENSQSEANEILVKFMKSLGFSNKELKKYAEDYELEKKLYATDISSVTLEEIKAIEKEYGESEDVMRLRCKYQVYNKNYDQAKRAASQLVDEYRNEENYVIYTDIIAQQAYERELMSLNGNAEDVYDMKDAEVSRLVKQANRKKSEAEKLMGDNSGNDEVLQERIDELLYDAEELYKEANYISVERAINYIIAKKPAKGDNTGIYDLQLAKLYLIMGDRDTAHKYLYEVINNSVDISEDSNIKEALDEVVTQYNNISGDEFNAELNSAIDELIEKQSNGVVPKNDSSINGAFGSYVTNSLKYDKISIHISRIDTAKYPKIKAYININGTKEGETESELASDFVEKDFDIIDTQYEIKDFKILKDESNVSIGIVMDKSGSMDGAPIENAKMAATEAVNHMDTKTQKISIITYSDNASVVQELSNKKESMRRVINGINSNGGTHISRGLIAGIEEIKNEKGNRAIILMSDGQDGGSATEMEETVNLAKEEGISVYTVAFGNCNDEYMKSIAEATGGKFMKASDSSDLADIYLTIQKYIVNNYCIEYDITKNPDTDPRYLTVNIGKYSTLSTKEYYLNEKNNPGEGDEVQDAIEKIDENMIGISAVKASSAAIHNVNDGIELTLTGGGFEEGVMVTIGNIPLTNITVENKTTLKGTLKGDMIPGEYNIHVKTTAGKLAIGNKMFRVFKAGTATSVKVGCTTITADTIGFVDSDTLVATGNVMLNGFIHSAGDMQINVKNMDPSIDLDKNTTAYLGDSGKLEGNSKLYISYEEQRENNGGFTDMVMGGKDYVIQNERYAVNITSKGASFDGSITDFDLKIPFIMDIDIAEVNLYYNRLQVDIKTFDVGEIADNIESSIKKSIDPVGQKLKSAQKKEEEKLSIINDMSLSMALTPEGMEFGGEVKINPKNVIKLSKFEVKEISLKLNSLDENNEYWKMGGKIDFKKSIPGLEAPEKTENKDPDVTGFSGSLSSYYWLPDKIEINVNMDPGIPVYKIFELNKIGGNLQGMSTILLKSYELLLKPESYEILGTGINSEEYDYQDVILNSKLVAEGNIFNLFKGKSKLFQKFKEWGEFGEIEGNIDVNFSKPEFVIAAETCLLGSEKAKIEAIVGDSSLDIGASVDLDISGFGMKVKGGGDINIGSNLKGAHLGAGVNGELVCPALDIKAKGDASFKIEFEWNLSSAVVTVNFKDGAVNKEGSIWYNNDGDLIFWDDVHIEMPSPTVGGDGGGGGAAGGQ